MNQILDVSLGERSYTIHIGDGLLGRAEAVIAPLLAQPRVIVVADETVAVHYAPALKASLEKQSIRSEWLHVAGGEASKSFARYEQLMEDLLALKPERKTMLIALGGGVIGDLCGFAAATLLRGVDFIQIPTTLLAQVDSSVGGKTGINTRWGKNLVGAFHQPRAVIIDTDTLRTLPDREMRAGYAEVVKYGMLGDATFFGWLEANGNMVLEKKPEALAYAVHASCAAKATIVAADEREAGARALLNLGHTFAHALEAEAGYDGSLLHGEAVAIGMVMAARLSQRLGLCDEAVQQRLVEHLQATGLPYELSGDRWNADAIGAHFISDKKAEDGTLVFVLLRGIGQAEVMKAVDEGTVRDVVASFIR